MVTGPIRNEHLQRVLYYAKRIRYLHYKDVGFGLYAKFPRDIMTSVLMRMDKLGAFDSLRKICLQGPLYNDMLLPLTSPNLHDVTIWTHALPESTEIGVSSFLQSVAQSFHLRSLNIMGPFTDITFQVLTDFTILHRLSMHLLEFHIPVHFLKRFASCMPTLRFLHINIGSSYPPHTTDISTGLGQP